MLLILPENEEGSSAFDSLVDLYERRIFNLIFRMIGDYDEAADLTQDTFVSAYRSFENFRGEADSFTWLYRIAVNVCKNRFREMDRRRGIEAYSLDEECDSIDRMADDGRSNAPPTPERALEARETRRVIERAIDALPYDYKIIVVLRELQGLSYKEIAGTIDINIDLVKTRLARARGMLRKKLEGYLI